MFLLLIEEFLIIKHLAHRRSGIGRDFNQVEPLGLCNLQSLLNGIYACLYVVTDQTYLAGTNAFVDCVKVFGCVAAPAGRAVVIATQTRYKRFFLHSMSRIISHVFDLFSQNFCKVSNFHRSFITFALFSY